VEHQTVLTGLSRSLLILLALAPLSCDDRLCTADAEALRMANRSAALFGSRDGCSTAITFTGRQLETFTLQPGELIDSMMPDLHGWTYVKSTTGIHHQLISSSLWVHRIDEAPLEVLRQANSENFHAPLEASYKTRWASPDGTVFLVHHHGIVWLIRRCRSEVEAIQIASGVQSFAATDSRVYFLPLEARSSLHWRDLPGTGGTASGELALPKAFDGVESGPAPHQALLFRQLPRGHGFIEFYLLDASTGRGCWLPIKAPAEVISILPIRGTQRAILELDAGERFDGRALADFALWDYRDGSVQRLFCSTFDRKLVELPANLSSPRLTSCEAGRVR
jgi:hypothetical protein